VRTIRLCSCANRGRRVGYAAISMSLTGTSETSVADAWIVRFQVHSRHDALAAA
jgi:hypothetical protein